MRNIDNAKYENGALRAARHGFYPESRAAPRFQIPVRTETRLAKEGSMIYRKLSPKRLASRAGVALDTVLTRHGQKSVRFK